MPKMSMYCFVDIATEINTLTNYLQLDFLVDRKEGQLLANHSAVVLARAKQSWEAIKPVPAMPIGFFSPHHPETVSLVSALLFK